MFSLKTLHFIRLNLSKICRQQIDLLRNTWAGRQADPARAPASTCQTRFYHMQQLHPDSVALAVRMQLNYHGHINVPAFERAVNAMITSNSIFRTRFQQQGSELVQHVEKSYQWQAQVHHLDEAFSDTDQAQYIEELSSQPFDLEKLPLFRIHILLTQDKQTKILLYFHHIIWDGWSHYLFCEDIAKLYEQALATSGPLQAPKRMHYSEYAQMERNYARKASPKVIAFWRDYLAKHQEMPLSLLRTSSLAKRRSKCYLPMIDTRTMNAVRARCTSMDCTVNTFMVSVFLVLLHAHSGAEYVNTLLPRFSRFHPKLQKIYGPMLNALPLIMRVDPKESFAAFVVRVQAQISELCQYDDIPYDRLVAEIAKQDSSFKGAPRFQTLFNYISPQWAFPVELSGLSFQKENLVCPEIEHDMVLYMSGRRTDGAMGINVAYRTASSTADEVRILVEQYLELAAAFADAPETTIEQQPLQTRNHIAKTPNLEEPPAKASYQSLPLALLRTARQHSERCFLQLDKHEWTYGQLLSRTVDYAAMLQTRSKGPASPLVITGARNLDFHAALAAALCLGFPVYLLDDELPEFQVRERLELIKPDLAVITSSLRSRTARLLDTSYSTINARAVLNASDHESGFETLMESASMRRPEEKAYYAFTSGSTARAKAIIGTHGALSHFIHWQVNQFRLGQYDRCAQLTNVSFDVVLREILTPMLAGAALVHPPGRDWLACLNTLEWIKDQQVTFFHCVPSLLHLFIRRVRGGGQMLLTELRWVFCAGEPLKRQLIQSWTQATYTLASIVNIYGPSETVLAKAFHVVPVEPDYENIPVGQPIPETSILVVRDKGQACGIGEVGEVVIRSPHRSLGYVIESTPTFEPNPISRDPQDLLYFTKDLGFYNAQGDLVICGRKGDQLKIDGVRVHPNALSAICLDHPNIVEAAVCVKQDRNKPRLALFVSYEAVAEDKAVTVRKLYSWLHEHVPQSMNPSTITILPNGLPRLPSGKVDRLSLAELPEFELNKRHEYVAPSTHTEKRIQGLISKQFGRHDISCDLRLEELGADSLGIVQCLLSIQDEFEVRFSHKELRGPHTIAKLASIVEHHLSQTRPDAPSQSDFGQLTVAELLQHYEAYSVSASSTQLRSDYKNVFLTGCTGFLGAYLLRELLFQDPDRHVHCLVRAESPEAAFSRIEKALEEINFDTDLAAGRIHAVQGDLSAPQFGVDPTSYAHLASEIDAIIHCGAHVDFLLPFEQLNVPNVGGTLAALELSQAVVSKPFAFISTAGIFPLHENFRGVAIPESVSFDWSADSVILGGYAQSKWLADYTVAQAIESGLAASIYRVGRVSGDLETGYWPSHDFVYSFLRSVKELGVAPKLPIHVDLLPVNIAAKMIVNIECLGLSRAQALNLVNPHSMRVEDLAKEVHPGVELLEYPDWRRVVIEATKRGTSTALGPFISLFPEDANQQPRLRFDRLFDTQCTQELLKQHGPMFPRIDQRVLRSLHNPGS